METLVPIGTFAKMTYLSVKALRHYHDVGLLEPAAVDQSTGYRWYSTTQVPTAQAIRRFRELDMPIDDVLAVLHARDAATRAAVIVAHLDRMQQQLERTQQTVASLQTLLASEQRAASVDYRVLDPVLSVTIDARVRFDDAGDWCTAAFAELHEIVASHGAQTSGPDGALYFDEFFEDGEGPVTAFVPVDRRLEPTGRGAVVELPSTRVAVMLHEGPFGELDRTYGMLGTIVAERGVGGSGPIREHYLSDERTEVCWPIQTIVTR
jgi:DNA-binding transcriptional MerR regulator